MNYDGEVIKNTMNNENKAPLTIEINHKRIEKRILINKIAKYVFFSSTLFALVVLAL